MATTEDLLPWWPFSEPVATNADCIVASAPDAPWGVPRVAAHHPPSIAGEPSLFRNTGRKIAPKDARGRRHAGRGGWNHGPDQPGDRRLR